ncbi:MAG: SpoIIE family protein phosphatase [Holosporaceae bacterium]|jgi:sigma-B regulation protein RsbU (phosphoserine phosphatase)|nr:SpoIIE family protein phosphatase [Holosporaceae bacterium]
MTEVNVLVLDDDKDTQDLFQQKFRHKIMGGTYKFSFATCLDETINMLRYQPFEIFVSDINVNGMDGIGFISQLRKQYPLMKSVVISAYGDINTLRAAMRGGAHDFVIKPIDFNDFEKTLDKTAYVVEQLKLAEATSQKLSAISDELDVSAQLQKSILPGNSLKKGGVEIWADTIPAAEVGGDFYDFFWLSETRLGIVMADVSGKNVSAAMFALIAKTLIKSFSRIYSSPAECFDNVNRTLYNENAASMFVTAIYGIVDMEEKKLIYTNAGHLPIIVVRPGQPPELLECDPGLPLGISEDVIFVNSTHEFAPGEFIMLYTDGVPEAADKNGNEYDYERFNDVLQKNATLPPSLLTTALIESIRKFAGGASQSDDITTLCLKYRLRVTPNVN